MRTLPDQIRRMQVGERQVAVDEQGYLVEPEDWTEDVAEAMAAQLGVQLGDGHWALIRFMREFLAEHGVAPDARFAFRFLEERAGEGAGRSGRDLFFDLFPYGYVGQACRISGMRQPRAWSTG